MRRRHKKNTLLWRILGISVLVHILALPILAHYGAFKKIEQRYLDTRLVTLPAPPKEQPKQEAKQPKHVAKAATAHKTAGPAHQNRQMAHQAPVNIPKVVASAGGPGGPGGEPTVTANGTGKVGEVPTPAPATKAPANPPPPASAPKPEPKPEPAPTPQPKPVETPKPAPQPKALETQPAPKAPVFTEVATTFAPPPAIPDDLRADTLDKTVVVEFTVGPDGSPTSVKIAQSTGVDELDRIALETARKWKFKPATRDGAPVESVVRLHIEFQVS